MSDIREVVITIKNESEAPQDKPNKVVKPKIEEQQSSSAKGVALMASNYATQILENELSYQFDKFVNLSDDYQLQKTVSRSKAIISRTMSITNSAMTGFLIGGPYGMAIALIGEGAKMAQDIYHNMDQQNIRISQMNEQLSFTRQKVGYSLTAGSQGENR